MEKVRLQKYMSQSGICSRRKAEDYISRGLVKINGQIAKIGESVCPKTDNIELLNKAIEEQQNLVYYKLNKPRGIETTCAQHNEKNIVDIMDVKERVFPVGRLDKETTGLILMTNDGRLANFLMHPRYEHSKEYIVDTFGPINDGQLEMLKKSMFILGSYTKEAVIERLASGTFSIIIKEGKNRQIRRMVERVGSRVKKLKRVRIENIVLGGLGYGEYKHLTKGELKELFNTLGLKKD